MICVDASLVVAWLLPEELSEKATVLRDNLLSQREEFISPQLLVAEVSSVLRNHVHREKISSNVGEEAFETFRHLPIRLLELNNLMPKAWLWAKSLNAPRTYDMFYVALAEDQSCDLWTADRRLARLASKGSKRVRWVGDLQ